LQTLASLSRASSPPLLIHHCLSATACPSVMHPNLGEHCYFMGKGKNSGVLSSKKMTEVDEDQVLEVIENKKFLAMRAATSSWPIPSTMEEQLKELADKGLIQDQGLAE
jgi:hypothetical protein